MKRKKRTKPCVGCSRWLERVGPKVRPIRLNRRGLCRACVQAEAETKAARAGLKRAQKQATLRFERAARKHRVRVTAGKLEVVSTTIGWPFEIGVSAWRITDAKVSGALAAALCRDAFRLNLPIRISAGRRHPIEGRAYVTGMQVKGLYSEDGARWSLEGAGRFKRVERATPKGKARRR